MQLGRNRPFLERFRTLREIYVDAPEAKLKCPRKRGSVEQCHAASGGTFTMPNPALPSTVDTGPAFFGPGDRFGAVQRVQAGSRGVRR